MKFIHGVIVLALFSAYLNKGVFEKRLEEAPAAIKSISQKSVYRPSQVIAPVKNHRQLGGTANLDLLNKFSRRFAQSKPSPKPHLIKFKAVEPSTSLKSKYSDFAAILNSKAPKELSTVDAIKSLSVDSQISKKKALNREADGISGKHPLKMNDLAHGTEQQNKELLESVKPNLKHFAVQKQGPIAGFEVSQGKKIIGPKKVAFARKANKKGASQQPRNNPNQQGANQKGANQQGSTSNQSDGGDYQPMYEFSRLEDFQPQFDDDRRKLYDLRDGPNSLTESKKSSAIHELNPSLNKMHENII